MEVRLVLAGGGWQEKAFAFKPEAGRYLGQVGYKAQRELEQTEWQVSLTLAGPSTQLWVSKVLGRYSISEDEKEGWWGPLSRQSSPGGREDKSCHGGPICEEACRLAGRHCCRRRRKAELGRI